MAWEGTVLNSHDLASAQATQAQHHLILSKQYRDVVTCSLTAHSGWLPHLSNFALTYILTIACTYSTYGAQLCAWSVHVLASVELNHWVSCPCMKCRNTSLHAHMYIHSFNGQICITLYSIYKDVLPEFVFAVLLLGYIFHVATKICIYLTTIQGESTYRLLVCWPEENVSV